MNKHMLRENKLKQLRHVPEADRQDIEYNLKYYLTTSEVWKRSNVIGLTIAGGIEWDTYPIIQKAWDEGKTVVVPKCRPKNHQLDFYILNDYNQLETSIYNLLEPIPEQTKLVEKNSIDLLIVPGLVFNYEGYRIGFGGGYYDRYLSDFPNDKLALAAEMQIVRNLPVESFDIPVDRIITENGPL